MKMLMVALVMVVLLSGSLHAHAQSGGVYEVWGNLGPGGTVSGGVYEIAATLGQPDAGQVSGGAYTLGGGFWGGGAVIPASGGYQVYLPVVIR